MKLSGAEIIVKLLEKQGIKIISGIPGGATLPIYDVLWDSTIRHVLARHEQGAGFIAQGMARSTGKPAVCLGTSGPGATNLLTAIADAKLDSIPIIVITGQVPRTLIGTDAFQEVDTYGLTLPITKHNYLVQRTQDLLTIIPEAFELATSGRPGPVTIDVPVDVQKEIIDVDTLPEPAQLSPPATCIAEDIKRIADMIHRSKRPVLYVGGGIISAGASDALVRLAEKNGIPVVSTLMGLGCIPHDHPLFMGMIGMHGARYTNLILEETDVLLAFGVRFDDRATGKAQSFCKHAVIAHVDIDRSEIDKIKRSNCSIVCDVRSALTDLYAEINDNERLTWNTRVTELKANHPFRLPESTPYHPLAIIRRIGELAHSTAIIATDVGQHQMWVAQSYPFQGPRTFLTSGGLGTMGFGLPAAIGAALAHPERQIICISGDGSFLMNIQELATIAEQQLNIKTIIMNNNHLGLVRQQQELFYNKRYSASGFDTAPDFAAISEGFGIKGYTIDSGINTAGILSRIFDTPVPAVINIPIDHRLNVYPMVPPGAPNNTMIGGECHV